MSRRLPIGNDELVPRPVLFCPSTCLRQQDCEASLLRSHEPELLHLGRDKQNRDPNMHFQLRQQSLERSVRNRLSLRPYGFEQAKRH